MANLGHPRSIAASSAVAMAGIETADGIFTAYFTPQGLARLEFPGTDPKRKPPADATSLKEHRSSLRLTTQALHQALAGHQPHPLPPLDLSAGTPFQQEVWQFLLALPPGEVRTYGEVAEALDRPGSARAVGRACGANPIPVLVPCHRVLAAQGALGGYSAGLSWKRRLLKREGVILP